MKKLFLVSLLSISSLLASCGVLDSLAQSQAEYQASVQAEASQNATDYASKLGGKLISCSSLDSDTNGYVSCDVTDESGKIQPLECAYGRYMASGCKTRMNTPQINVQSN